MILDIEDRKFDNYVTKAPVPVLVEFWQPGCSHCQALTRELELLQAELEDQLFILKMNVQENHLIAAELEIQSLPALALYINGEFQTFIGGIGKKQELLKHIQPWLTPQP